MDNTTGNNRPGSDVSENESDVEETERGPGNKNVGDKSGKTKMHSYDIAFKLAAVDFAKTNSKESTARKFKVAPKRIREWVKQEEALRSESDVKRKRNEGGGKKWASEDMEEFLVSWIEELRDRRLRVTRKMVMNKTKDVFTDEDLDDKTMERFTASRGWLQKFMEHNGISMRRKTTVGQKMLQDVILTLVGFILYVRALRVKHSYQLSNIFAMDETACWLNMPAPTTLEKTGAIEVPIHSTGHDKSRFTVCLTAKADGSKCKPLIVFKGKRIDKELTKVTGVIIKMASNGWMNEELTQ